MRWIADLGAQQSSVDGQKEAAGFVDGQRLADACGLHTRRQWKCFEAPITEIADAHRSLDPYGFVGGDQELVDVVAGNLVDFRPLLDAHTLLPYHPPLPAPPKKALFFLGQVSQGH